MTSTLPRRLLVPRLGSTQLLAADAVFAVVLALVCGYAATEAPLSAGVGVREPVWLSWLVGAMIGLPLAVRRRWPVAAAATVLVASAAGLLTGVIPDYAGAAPTAAIAGTLYLVGVATPWRRSVATLAVCLAGVTVALVAGILWSGGWSGARSPDSASADLGVAAGIGEIGFACLAVGTAWLAGRMVRERRTLAARTAEQATHRAVSDERLRIARELHDVVAHTMSLIAVKAAVANHVAERSPGEARDALQIIETTSRGALLEIRRALGVLREDASYSPTPGVDDLADLAQRAAIGGVDVDLQVQCCGELPEAVGLSVFRIVQESLTNVVKHAAPARCRATVVVDNEVVTIKVTDDGRRAAAPVTLGHGLLGMRERVSMYGGDFAVGPLPDGGFMVTARLPYASAS